MLQRPRFGKKHRVLRAAHPLAVLAQFFLPGVIGALYLQSRLSQLLLQAGIPPGVKQLLEYTAAILRLGKQQTQKIPLRQHGDLAKLIVIQPKQGGDFVIHVRLFGNHPVIRAGQLRHSVLGSHTLAPGLGSPVFRAAAHGVYRPVVCKSQLCKGGSLRRCVLGAQGGWFPAFAAGLAIQRKNNAVKNGGLASTGIAGNQIHAAGTQLGKIQHLLPSVRAKGGQSKF